jgi:hypothetical protein
MIMMYSHFNKWGSRLAPPTDCQQDAIIGYFGQLTGNAVNEEIIE